MVPPSPSPSQRKIPSPQPEAAVTSSPRFCVSNPISCSQRRIGIAVDLSDESAFSVRWAVQNYLRKGDAVILVHVRPTSVLYGADWGAMDLSLSNDDQDQRHTPDSPHHPKPRPSPASQQKMEEDFDLFTNKKANDLAEPLVKSSIPFKIHIVKDHDMKERLCLEVERLGLSALVMGSRGFGASRRATKGRLGSVSDYCVHHCVCPVIVVRFPDDKDGGDGEGGSGDKEIPIVEVDEDGEEREFHDASDKQADMEKAY